MATRLLLMRHARIEAQYVGRLIGATHLPLDPAGEAERGPWPGDWRGGRHRPAIAARCNAAGKRQRP